jgi:hypothetical protein
VITVPFFDEDEAGPPATGGKTYTLTIKFVQDIDMSTLVKYLAHDPQVGVSFSLLEMREDQQLYSTGTRISRPWFQR